MIKNFLENKKAVLFDLDGTLVDSMWMWEAIDIEFLGAYGYECPDDIQRAIEGMSFSETAVYFKERFDLPLSLDEIKAVWTRMSIDKYRHEVPLKPGGERDPHRNRDQQRKRDRRCGPDIFEGERIL